MQIFENVLHPSMYLSRKGLVTLLANFCYVVLNVVKSILIILNFIFLPLFWGILMFKMFTHLMFAITLPMSPNRVPWCLTVTLVNCEVWIPSTYVNMYIDEIRMAQCRH